MAWVSPTGYNDPSSAWGYEYYAYDGNILTTASTVAFANGWCGFLELTISPISCHKIQYMPYQTNSEIDLIDVDVWYSSAWHHVYQGAYVSGSWVEKSLGGTYTVSKMRFSFHNNSAITRNAHLKEAEFNNALATVTTQAVSDIAVTTITGNGNITSIGSDNCTRRGFCYIEGEAGDPTTADSTAYDDGSFGTGAYTKGITGLSASTNYRVRAYAINPSGTSYGTTVQTTTGAIPTVTTQAVTAIDKTTATGNGNITSIGGENATKRGVCWNTTGSPTVADSKSEELGSFGTGAFTRPMTGLVRGDRYYVKAYAYNTGGYAYGAEVNFYTYPAVTTYAPTDIIRADPTSVTANGLIELDVVEDITTRGFKYGLTEADTWDESENGGGTYTEGAFSLTLTGLTADTTYFIRAYAIGAWGTKYGSYVEFKTAYSYGANKVEIKSEATASDADIALVGGKRSLTINNHLIQTQTIADIVSAAYLADYKDQKTKLRVTKPTPAPYTIGDTIERIGAKLPYYAAVSALISYATAADAVHYYNLAGRDMLIRKLNVSFSAGNYVSVLELES